MEIVQHERGLLPVETVGMEHDNILNFLPNETATYILLREVSLTL